MAQDLQLAAQANRMQRVSDSKVGCVLIVSCEPRAPRFQNDGVALNEGGANGIALHGKVLLNCSSWPNLLYGLRNLGGGPSFFSNGASGCNVGHGLAASRQPSEVWPNLLYGLGNSGGGAIYLSNYASGCNVGYVVVVSRQPSKQVSTRHPWLRGLAMAKRQSALAAVPASRREVNRDAGYVAECPPC